MANIVPQVNFDWIGQLPDISREQEERRAIQASLADLESNDPAAIRNKANALLKIGGVRSTETGLKLHEAATKMELAAAQNAYIQKIPLIAAAYGNKQPGAPGPMGTTTAPDGTLLNPFSSVMPGGPGTPGTAAPGPATDWGPNPMANPPGPRSALPGGPQVAESPSDEMITQAQRAMAGGQPPPPPTGPQFAQAGSRPQIPPQQQPLPPGAEPIPPGIPSRAPPGLPTGAPPPGPFGGTQAPVVRNQPPGGAPPQQPQQQLPVLPGLTESEVARMHQIGQILSQVGSRPGQKPEAVSLLKDEFKALVAKATIDKNTKQWLSDNADRVARGIAPQSEKDYNLEVSTGQERYKELLDETKLVRREADKHEQLIGRLQVLESMTKNKKFISGVGTEPVVQRFGSMAAGVKSTLVALGVPESSLPDISRITEPAARMEVFGALVNQAVVSALGGLGNQISNPDRDYIATSFPNLRFTPEGNKLLIEVMQKLTERGRMAGRIADKYRSEEGPRGTAHGLRMKIDEFADKHSIVRDSNGNLTDLGQRLENELKKQSTEETGPVRPGRQAPAAAPLGGGRPSPTRAPPGPGPAQGLPPPPAGSAMPGSIIWKGNQPHILNEDGSTTPTTMRGM